MKLARYTGKGNLLIADEPVPCLPEGGLLVKTEACGLCSGELMDWYMDHKVPHVFGHEVAGIVVESDDDRYPVGCRVFPHHHAPCLSCQECRRGLYVHCIQWKASKLVPGGMAEFFAVGKENLNDTIRADHLRPRDAALIEPLACVAKSIRSAGVASTDNQHAKQAVIGLGTMGLMHMLVLPDARGYDLKAGRVEWARNLGLDASHSDAATTADIVIVCPGNADALALATRMVAPGGTIVLFAPMPPTGPTRLDLNGLYFKDARLVSSYSCGPTDTAAATELIRAGTIRAEQVVSDFIRLDELPKAYQAMKAGEILKAMVMFS